MYIFFIIMFSRDDMVSSGHSMPGTRDGQTGRRASLLNMKCTCFLHFIFEISKYRIDPSDRSEGPSRIAISLRNLEDLEWVHCTHSKPGSAMGTLRPWWLDILKIRVKLNPNYSFSKP